MTGQELVAMVRSPFTPGLQGPGAEAARRVLDEERVLRTTPPVEFGPDALSHADLCEFRLELMVKRGLEPPPGEVEAIRELRYRGGSFRFASIAAERHRIGVYFEMDEDLPFACVVYTPRNPDPGPPARDPSRGWRA